MSTPHNVAHLIEQNEYRSECDTNALKIFRYSQIASWHERNSLGDKSRIAAASKLNASISEEMQMMEREVMTMRKVELQKLLHSDACKVEVELRGMGLALWKDRS